jgi:hypothetical protein
MANLATSLRGLRTKTLSIGTDSLKSDSGPGMMSSVCTFMLFAIAKLCLQ